MDISTIICYNIDKSDVSPSAFLCLFFFISNKDVYSRTLLHAESHKAEKKITEREDTNYKGES